MQDFLAAHPLESDLERERALAILARVGEREGTPCPGCGAALGGREIVESIVLGHQDEPLCRDCLAAGHGEERGAFLARLREYVDRVPCFHAAWSWCGRERAAGDEARRDSESPPPEAGSAANDGDTPRVAAEWDAGDTGCGDLVLELRGRLRALAPGEVLLLRATDPGAPADIPAWCGLTRNPLRRATPPHYWIARRDP